MEELKPCPFCGGEGKLQSHPGNPMTTGWFNSVECQSCFGGTFHYADTKEKAIEAWNERIPPATASKGVDVGKLEEIIYPYMSGLAIAQMLNGTGDWSEEKQEALEGLVKEIATAIKEAIEKGEINA